MQLTAAPLVAILSLGLTPWLTASASGATPLAQAGDQVSVAEDGEPAAKAKKSKKSKKSKGSVKPVKHPWWRGPGGLTFSNRGLELRNPDRGWRLRFGGRAHLDRVSFNNDVTTFNDDTDFRRLRVYASGRWKDFAARAEKDIGGTIQGWKSVYARYYGIEGVRLTAGNQIPSFSMEENTSSNSIPFLERSLSNSLSPGFLNGITASTKGDNWAFGVGYYGNPIDGQPKRRSRGHGWNLRGTWAPVLEDTTLMHVGASLEVRNIDPGSRYRIRARPESGLARSRLLDTRSILDVQDTVTWGTESIMRYESLTLQGEYIMSQLNRSNAVTTFTGWSARAGWLLRGGRRPYRVRNGALGSLVARDRAGALELSARVSHLDLNDDDITGGVGTNYSLGLDWTLNRNIRVMTESVFARARPNRNGVDEQLRLFQVRLQLTL